MFQTYILPYFGGGVCVVDCGAAVGRGTDGGAGLGLALLLSCWKENKHIAAVIMNWEGGGGVGLQQIIILSLSFG